MAYKIIATILTDTDQSTEGLDAAISLADRMQAHLDIYVVTISHTETAGHYLGMAPVVIAEQTKAAMDARDKIETWVNDRMQGEMTKWSSHAATVQGASLTD